MFSNYFIDIIIGKEILRYTSKCNLANTRMAKTDQEVYAKIAFVRVKGVYISPCLIALDLQRKNASLYCEYLVCIYLMNCDENSCFASCSITSL